MWWKGLVWVEISDSDWSEDLIRCLATTITHKIFTILTNLTFSPLSLLKHDLYSIQQLESREAVEKDENGGGRGGEAKDECEEEKKEDLEEGETIRGTVVPPQSKEDKGVAETREAMGEFERRDAVGMAPETREGLDTTYLLPDTFTYDPEILANLGVSE